MFIYRNALKNLLRNKGRNILMAVILLIVMTATTVSLSVNSMSDTMIDTYKEGFGVESSIMVDWDWANANTKPITVENPDGSITTTSNLPDIEIPIEQYVKFSNSQYVKETLFSATAPYASEQLKPLEQSPFNSGTLEELMAAYGVNTREELVMLFGGGNDGEEYLGSLLDAKPNTVGMLWGYSNATLMKDFRKGEKRLTEGRLFEGDGEVLISKELAAKNNIKLGDTINVSGGSIKHDTTTIDLKVVGIFEDLKGNAQPQMGEKVEITAGKEDLIVSFDTLYAGDFYRASPGTMIYYLTDPEAPKPFLAEMRQKGLHEMFTLDYDVDTYNKIVEPVKDMSGVAVTFGIVILITGAVILVFLSVINIRERKYEVGVLRAIGMKKHQLARSMIYESLSLVTICTLLGLPLGGLLANPIAGVLLDTSESIGIAASFNMGLLPLILLVAVTLGILSSLIGILYITRYEPMKILQERN